MSGTRMNHGAQIKIEGVTQVYETNVLPVQFFRSQATDTILKTPEGRLCYAMLEDALHVIRSQAGRHCKRNDQLERDIEWVESKSKAVWSFEFICQHLHINADLIRQFVNTLVQQGKAATQGKHHG